MNPVRRPLTHLSTGLLVLCTIALPACTTSAKTRTQGMGTQPAATGTSGSYAPPAVSTETLSPSLSKEQKREQEKLLHRKLIGQMMEQGSWYAALAHCDAYDQQYGQDSNSRLLRADAKRMTGQLPGAEALYQGLRDTPLRPQALHGLSQIAAQRGQWTQASALIADAIRLQPLNARLYNDQGLLLMLLNRPQEAFVALRKSQELEPERNLARANLALYAAVFNEDPLFQAISNELNWKNGDIETVRAQALRIRTAHLQGKVPDPDIFSGR